MGIRFVTEYVEVSGWSGWVDFEGVDCDVSTVMCEGTYPPPRDGDERPADERFCECGRLEAWQGGWQIDRVSGRVCCPSCHLYVMNGEG